MLKKLKIWLPVILILLGAAVLFFALRGGEEKGEVFSEQFFEEGSNTEYLGIYLKGHKVGYMASRIDTIDDGYRVFSNTYMKIAPAAGMEREVSYRVAATTDRSYNLKDFNFRMISENHVFTAEGSREGDRLLVNMNMGGQERKMEFPLETDYIPATIEGVVKTGKTGTFEFFDPTLQSMFSIEVSKIGKDTLDGEPAVKYSVEKSGIKMDFWVSEGGKLLREETPIGLVMKREEGDVTEGIETAGFKLYDSYAITPDKEIVNPREVKFLKVRLDSVDLSGLRIQDDRQKLSGNVLAVKKLGPGDGENEPSVVKEYTGESAFIPCEDEKVIKTAEMVRGNSEGFEAVKRIVHYVDTLLVDKPTFSIPNALDALRSGEGDCNEHSALAVALLRAIGIPARTEVGIVYVRRSFYYHAWIGVYLGGQWFSVDPTFGQIITDATHIKLEHGGFENQAKLYRVINKLRISVLDYD